MQKISKKALEVRLETLQEALAMLENAQIEMNDALDTINEENVKGEIPQGISTAINELGFAIEELEYLCSHIEEIIFDKQ